MDWADCPVHLKKIIDVAKTIEFSSNITFFTGENGSGKSTIIKIIAAGMDAYALGYSGHVTSDPYLNITSKLSELYYFSRTKKARTRMLLRSEDILGYVKYLNDYEIDNGKETHSSSLKKNSFDNQQLIDTINSNQLGIKSYGQILIELINNRVHDEGLYLLDEPDTPLSIMNQIILSETIKEKSRNGAQFIIATHSPILLRNKNATIYEFSEDGIKQKQFDELRSVYLLKRYLSDRDFLNEEN
ncbi:AAA family ATPase [Agrobacterium vitis]|uniref:AAA family ATPase n=3 Tax=Agrobacterium vitis TaxID=373 RepID=UPI0015748F31|nr:AAA family ATPase [Agrobacterium vitis]NSY12558.1 AAA family ATPase [Agrobacterium vitis]NSY22315.1 AAA family ATPase [Agrobacterium vitis]NTA22016.1 AAA family ATPase [Agrobacterium vitis]WEO70309.1 AAA family ATPase [Agrobacterium vitis]